MTNRMELTAAVAEKTELPKKDVKKAVKTFIDVVSKELIKGEKVQLVGFGAFEISEGAAREGGNPRTGKTITTETLKTPKFKAGKALEDKASK